MNIRNMVREDRAEILLVHQKSFGESKGPTIAKLVDDMLDDPTARPIYSFVAVIEGEIVGHVLFSRTTVQGASSALNAQILAPLAVLPAYQAGGIGQKLINYGLEKLQQDGCQLVFVLGHPSYYPRCGFIPAGRQGFAAPYPIPEEHAGAWMVQQLCQGILGNEKGTVQCSDVLNAPEHWRE